MKHLAIIRAELIAYLSDVSALFWTFAYPILMLVLLIAFFDQGDAVHTIDGYRARTVLGLITLTIISTSIFGMAQTFCEHRARNYFVHYYLSDLKLFPITLSIMTSRIIIVLVYSIIYLYVNLHILDIDHDFTLAFFVSILVALISSCIFSFSLAIPLSYYCRSSQTMIAIANFLNLYAIMSSDVFIPLKALPEWTTPFITTSPFYHLNQMLRNSVENPNATIVWISALLLIASGLIISGLYSRRLLYLHDAK